MHRAILIFVLVSLLYGQSGNHLFERALAKERAEGNLEAAISLYREVVQKHAANRALAAKALVRLAGCYEKLANPEAAKTYQRILTAYADQKESVAEARRRLAKLPETTRPRAETSVRGRLLVGPTYHLPGGASPDGSFISYWDARNSLVVHHVASGAERKIPVKPLKVSSYTWYPKISPDNSLIAYVVQENREPPELRIVNRDGGEERALLQGPDIRGIAAHDWTPDGRNVLVTFTRAGQPPSLALVPVNEGELRILKSPAPGRGGHLSPDGRFFAYRDQSSPPGATAPIRVYAIDGSFDVLLADDPASTWSIGWTAEGKYVYYSAQPGSKGVWMVPTANGKRAGPVQPLVDAFNADILPIGLTRGGAFFYHDFRGASRFQVYLMEMDPASGRPLSSSVIRSPGQMCNSPEFSPDGHYLAYGAGNGIRIRTLANGEDRDVPVRLFPMALRWFPDQFALAVQSSGPFGNATGLYRVEVASGRVSPILIGSDWTDFAANPTFTPDGKRVIYKARTEGITRVLVEYDLDTREQKQIRIDTASVHSFSVLPKQGRIAVVGSEADKTQSVRIVEPDGHSRILYRVPEGEFIPALSSVEWMPDGKSILVSKAKTPTPPSPRHSLWRIPLDGGDPVRLFEGGAIYHIRAHPAGRWIAVDNRETNAETLVVDNLLALGRTRQ